MSWWYWTHPWWNLRKRLWIMRKNKELGWDVTFCKPYVLEVLHDLP